MEIQPAGSSQSFRGSPAPRAASERARLGNRRERFLALRDAAPVVVPSLLLCDFGHLADEVQRLEEAGVHSFHLDVMDGHFVPNLTYGLPIVAAVRRLTELPIEVHLMISEPLRYGEQFFEAGADAVTFHIEALPNPRPLLEKLRQRGAIAGLAYNPGTPLSAIADYLDACDLALTMSVSPGFGGQAFESVALEKLSALRDRTEGKVLLEVDGGVNANTIGKCAEAGAQLHVVGSAIFSHHDYAESIASLTRSATLQSRST